MKNNARKIKLSFNSPIVLGFTLLCFAALALNWVTKGWANRTFFSVYHSSLLSPFTYIRMLGHVLGHANWSHFIGNIMLILVVGPLLEGTIPVTLLLVGIIYIGGQIYEGLFVYNNVANLTHILGGLVGGGLGYVMHKNKMNRY